MHALLVTALKISVLPYGVIHWIKDEMGKSRYD